MAVEVEFEQRILGLINTAREAAGVTPIEHISFETDAGWNDLIEEMFVKLIMSGWLGTVRQIKEKFGTLRAYLTDVGEEMQPIIDEACRRSGMTCETCGEPAETDEGDSGWIRTMCNSCKALRIRRRAVECKDFRGSPTMNQPGELYTHPGRYDQGLLIVYPVSQGRYNRWDIANKPPPVEERITLDEMERLVAAYEAEAK